MTRIELRPLEQVAVGTPLAADVRDDQGNLLVGAGTLLTERLSEQLARRGVETLPVALTHVLTEEERAALEARLAQRFSCVRGQPLMEQLYQMVLCYQMEKT